MGAFKSAVLTKKGQALLTKAVAGSAKIEFTKIAISATHIGGSTYDATTIGTIMQAEKIASIIAEDDHSVKVSVNFSNENLTEGYYIRTIGLYANDPDEGEILYSVSRAEDPNKADWMPPFSGAGVSSLYVDLITVVSNASDVNVTVDPNAGVTVAQMEHMQDQLDTVKSYIGYDDEDIYGVEVDYANNKFTRLAGAKGLSAGEDFSKLAPWQRRRCMLADDGVVLWYYGDQYYSEDGVTLTGLYKTVNGVGKDYPAGTQAQIMVEQPIFYVRVVPIETKTATSGKGVELVKARYYISSTPREGFKAPEVFRDDNGILQDKIYLSAYEGSVYDTSNGVYLIEDEQVADFETDKFCSIAGVMPASGAEQELTRDNLRKLCNNRGTGWACHNIFALSVTQWLMLVEYASMNVKTSIGVGACNLGETSATVNYIPTGGTAELGDTTGIPEDGVEGSCAVSYRGEENLWGNISTWLDRLTGLITAIGNDKIFTETYLHKTGTPISDLNFDLAEYENYGTRLSTEMGYISAFGYSDNHPEIFIPVATNGTSEQPVGSQYSTIRANSADYFAMTLGIQLGGNAVKNKIGLWNVAIYSHFISTKFSFIGGRLLYVPQTKTERD